MTAILTTISGYLIEPVLNFLKEKLCFLLSSPSVSALIIAYPEKNIILSLVSSNTMLIDLDIEVNNVMDEDEKNQTAVGFMLNPRIMYSKSVAVCKELIDVVTHSSKMVTKFVFISCDYNLLKYSESGKICYTLPSETYHQTMMLADDWDEVKFQKIKSQLLARKSDKLKIYNNFSELQAIIINNFNFKVKC
jgi:hypothetical protein